MPKKPPMNADERGFEEGKGQFLVYQAEDGTLKLDVRLEGETVWLTQALMAELFQTTKQNVSQHVLNVYEEGELLPEATHKKFLSVRLEGKREVKRLLDYYNLDMIISLGYRIKSHVATRFRIWATKQLTEFVRKGFLLDDERLKNPPVAGSGVPDYFDEMLERIRDIRASERRMYLRVREIFKLAADYEPSWGETTKFFSVIQNKLHYAVTGLTAAELIHQRADHQLPNMGLTSWKGDLVRKTDVTTAKNYLNEKEIDELNLIVSMWLDYAESQAKRRRQVFMKDWQEKLDEFLKFNERGVLPNAGNVSKKQADDHARFEYERFEVKRREHIENLAEDEYLRDLEQAAKQLPGKSRGGRKHGQA